MNYYYYIATFNGTHTSIEEDEPPYLILDEEE